MVCRENLRRDRLLSRKFMDTNPSRWTSHLQNIDFSQLFRQQQRSFACRLAFGGSTGQTIISSMAPAYQSSANDNRSTLIHLNTSIDARGATMTPAQFKAIADQSSAEAIARAAPHLISASTQATKNGVRAREGAWLRTRHGRFAVAIGSDKVGILENRWVEPTSHKWVKEMKTWAAIVFMLFFASCSAKPDWVDVSGKNRGETQSLADHADCYNASNPPANNASEPARRAFYTRIGSCMATKGWKPSYGTSN
jgi:hypothetical protein